MPRQIVVNVHEQIYDALKDCREKHFPFSSFSGFIRQTFKEFLEDFGYEFSEEIEIKMGRPFKSNEDAI